MEKAILKSDLTGNTKIDAIRQKYRFGVPAGEVEKCAAKIEELIWQENLS